MQDLVNRGASVNNSGSLQAAAANKMKPLILEHLVRLGGNVNHCDELGNHALHVAAACQQHKNVQFLINAGADPTKRNLDGDTPLDCLNNALQNYDDMFASFGMNNRVPSAEDVIPRLACFTSLMPANQRALLHHGWMSPRVKYMLEVTADLEIEFILDDRMDDVTSRMEYIPPAVWNQNREEDKFHRFVDGWGACFRVIREVLRQDLVPTVDRVHQYLVSREARESQHFLRNGGKVDFALDALINVTRNVLVDGDDGWEYGTFQDDIEALPSTPLDGAFDIVRFKCINEGGGEGTERGPYRGVRGFDNEVGDDYMDYDGDY